MANEQRRGMGRRMGGRMTVEKPKDFKGSIGKLFAYMKQYHAAVLIVMLCAVASTVFSVIGPDILGKATTELSNGLLRRFKAQAASTSRKSDRFSCLSSAYTCSARCSTLYRAGL